MCSHYFNFSKPVVKHEYDEFCENNIELLLSILEAYADDNSSNFARELLNVFLN